MISSLSLNENAQDILDDDSIKLLFVEFGWPGVSREETETVSLPKPKLGHYSSYNFQKGIRNRCNPTSHYCSNILTNVVVLTSYVILIIF